MIRLKFEGDEKMLTISNQATEMIQYEFPITDDQSIMEQYARMDYIQEADGSEWYASFTQIDDELVQITEWMPFEQAWIDYTALFTGEVIETRVTTVIDRLLSFIQGR